MSVLYRSCYKQKECLGVCSNEHNNTVLFQLVFSGKLNCTKSFESMVLLGGRSTVAVFSYKKPISSVCLCLNIKCDSFEPSWFPQIKKTRWLLALHFKTRTRHFRPSSSFLRFLPAFILAVLV